VPGPRLIVCVGNIRRRSCRSKECKGSAWWFFHADEGSRYARFVPIEPSAGPESKGMIGAAPQRPRMAEHPLPLNAL
jgi:hypothetical protein